MVRKLPGSALEAYPSHNHDDIRVMLERLNSLSWERYIVFFPFTYWTGAAHSKICNHSLEDINNDGCHVVEHIARSFRVDVAVAEAE